MAVTVAHTTQSAEPDSGDGKISSNAWNEAHTISGLGTMAERDAADYYTGAEIDAIANELSLAVPEQARDAVGAALTAGAGITVTVDDAGNTITLALNRGIPRIAANWYFPESYTGTLNAGVSAAANTIYYTPFVLDRPMTVSDLGVRITTGAASGNIKLAIYANNAITNRPTGTPLAETASISTASAVNVSADITGSNVALAADTLYWAAFWADGTAGGTVVLQGHALATVSNYSRFVGGAQDEISSAAAGGVSYVQSSETYGTWPNAGSETLTTTSNANRSYAIQLKAA